MASSEGLVDSTPFLANHRRSSSETNSSSRFVQRQSLRQAARFFRQASSWRTLRESSMRVRETAAEQLEERQSDWAYSKPIVILDIVWNFAFVAVATIILVLSRKESPNVPLRLWLAGYGFQCVLHIVCVCSEYKRRRQLRRIHIVNSVGDGNRTPGGSSSGSRQNLSLGQLNEEDPSLVFSVDIPCCSRFKITSVVVCPTMFSFVWWIVGFYWVSAGSQGLAHASPLLYWLCLIFLGFDVFFVVFCVALACVIGIAVCCCLPCIIALLYAVADQEGASREDIDQLSKFKFRKCDDSGELTSDVQESLGGIMAECGTDSPIEHVLSQQDAECCICLSAYDDGVELRELPCGHHFHCTCLDKWLHINATCPLCKYNILKFNSHGQDEV